MDSAVILGSPAAVILLSPLAVIRNILKKYALNVCIINTLLVYFLFFILNPLCYLIFFIFSKVLKNPIPNNAATKEYKASILIGDICRPNDSRTGITKNS